MGNLWNEEALSRLLENLKKDYDVFAPRLYAGTGCYSDTDIVRYGIIESFDEIVWDEKSDYSFKEALLPISDTIMYFTENSVKIPEEKRKRLIFLRACDLNALKRLDEIYLHNGPEDFYYKNIRENAKFILMGCSQSFKSCFCVSMGTNRTDDYALALKFSADGLLVQVADQSLAPYFQDMPRPITLLPLWRKMS